MQSVLDYVLDLFGQIVGIMKTTVFTVWGYSVSWFWLLLSITFMGFLFGALLPFAARAHNQYQKSTSERNDK